MGWSTLNAALSKGDFSAIFARIFSGFLLIFALVSIWSRGLSHANVGGDGGPLGLGARRRSWGFGGGVGCVRGGRTGVAVAGTVETTADGWSDRRKARL